MRERFLLLGVDGGGTRCRARLCDVSGRSLGEGVAGPANIRLGLEESFFSVRTATDQCLQQAGLEACDAQIVACLALAGASEPLDLKAAREHEHPFRKLIVTTDAHAACVGAHGGRDGGVIVIGTGTVGWAVHRGRHYRVGGWGFPISDDGSGAWLGCEVIRRVLWAHDGTLTWTALLTQVFQRFDSDPHAIVRWMGRAKPRDFASLAPLVVEQAVRNDPVASNLLRLAAAHIDALAARLLAFGVSRLALTGGLAHGVKPWLSFETTRTLVPPTGDAPSGALHLARRELEAAVLAD